MYDFLIVKKAFGNNKAIVNNVRVEYIEFFVFFVSDRSLVFINRPSLISISKSSPYSG